MRRVLFLMLFPLVAWAQVPIGGVQGVLPPSATKALTVTNSTFSGNLTGWTANACATYDGTHTHTADGTGSAKMVNCGAGNVDALTQNIVVDCSFSSIIMPFWIKADNAFNGTILATLFDNTHGPVALESLDGRTSTQIGPATGAETDWVFAQRELLLSSYLHCGDTLNFRIRVKDQTAGTVWVDDIGFQESFYPISCFVKHPNYRGYLYSGDSTVIDGVCEFSPLATSNASLTIKLASVAGCGSGVLTTLTPSITVPATPWQFDYSGLGLTQDSIYHICFSATVNSGAGAVGVTYPDWEIIPKSSAFKSGQVNTLTYDGALLHNFGSGQVRTAVVGAYESLSATNRCSTCVFQDGGCPVPQSSAKLCYETNIAGMGTNTPWSLVKHLTNSALFTDYKTIQYNAVLNINTLSAVNPTSGSDQLTPYLAAMTDNAMMHIQIFNNMFGSIITGTTAPGAPAFGNGSLSQTTGGSLTGPSVYVKIGELTAAAGTTASKPSTKETKLSALGTITLTGGNNHVVVTFPACDAQGIGFYYYAIQGSSPPASDTAFRRQGSDIWYDCNTPTADILTITDSGDPGNVLDITTVTRSGQTVTVNTTQNTANILKKPNFTLSGTTSSPNGDFNASCFNGTIVSANQFTCTQASGTDTSGTGGLASYDGTGDSNRPIWEGTTTTDTTAYNAFATVMGGNTGAGFIYPCDECLALDLTRVHWQKSILGPAANDVPMLSTAFAEGYYWDGLRNDSDLVASDPYEYGIAGTSDARWLLPAGDRSCTVYNTSNTTTTIGQCDATWPAAWSEVVTRRVYASRPVITVLQNFERGGAHGYIYAEQRKQAYAALVPCFSFGDKGCGILWWKHGDTSGSEDMWYTRLNTAFYTDLQNVNSEVKSLAAIANSNTLLDSSAPSPLAGFSTPGIGTVVTAVQMNSATITQAAVNSVCGLTGTWANGEVANLTNYPFGPVAFGVWQPSGNGTPVTVWTTNRCSAASSFTVTFSVKQSALPANNTGVTVL
jgi:hypothetical protein